MLTQQEALQQAHELHAKFHFSSKSIKTLYPQLTIQQCRHFTQSCSKCAPLLPLGPLQPQGVNPRGLSPNKLWQMDITHIPSFGKFKYVHVIVDIYSKFTYATPLTGETAEHVVQACMGAILFMGVPWAIQTMDLHIPQQI